MKIIAHDDYVNIVDEAGIISTYQINSIDIVTTDTKLTYESAYSYL